MADWAHATPEAIITDILAWKKRIEDNHRYMMEHRYEFSHFVDHRMRIGESSKIRFYRQYVFVGGDSWIVECVS